jgi:hypothetical protein
VSRSSLDCTYYERGAFATLGHEFLDGPLRKALGHRSGNEFAMCNYVDRLAHGWQYKCGGPGGTLAAGVPILLPLVSRRPSPKAAVLHVPEDVRLRR